ncbi:visual pigment-like receptor peropsin [Nematostella vectensis]|uniref:visual pigment-like receptor peropsin n=1 Tax=Nematostella vectensis TaxID=45351 RepID=UPI0020770949|nr:visual pigment-like receptor peropsin [Nematostella vectensis]
MTYKTICDKRIYPLVGTLWAWGMLWAVFPVLGWSGYELEPGETGCAITWNDQSTTNKSYIFIIFVIFFLLPMTLVIGCYAWVAKLARNMSTDALARWGRDAAASQATLRSEKENAWTSFVMFLGFLIAWSPYAIVSLYSAITGERVSPEAATIPGMLAKSASCYNPLIYVFLYSRFRRALSKLTRRGLVQPVDQTFHGTANATIRSVHNRTTTSSRTVTSTKHSLEVIKA